MKYTVTEKETGRIIGKGDIIKSFRGEDFVFEGVSRFREVGTSKIIASGGEYYDNVFGLKVELVD